MKFKWFYSHLLCFVVIGSVSVWQLQPKSGIPFGRDRLVALLQPYPWVKETKREILQKSLFSLSDSPTARRGFPTVALLPDNLFVPAKEQELFELDWKRFTESQRAKSFREAQVRYFAKSKFKLKEMSFEWDAPHLRGWGALPYPPVRIGSSEYKAMEKALEYEKTPFIETFLAQPKYHFELDRTTQSELTLNEEVRLYQNGETLKPLYEMVKRAKKYVFINVLAIACDSSTEELFTLLESRANAGIDVRILVDKKYSILSSGCLDRLRAAKIDIVRANTHSSYIVNDQGEALIGSQSLAKMFFDSTGVNFLDRDLMVWIRGPLETDILRHFLSLWEEYRAPESRSIGSYVYLLKDRAVHQFKQHLRGQEFYGRWLSQSPNGLCRFVIQKPGSRNTGALDLLMSLTRNSQEKVTFSGVKIGNTPVVDLLKEKAKQGLEVDFIGNGWEGGNGELSMVMDEVVENHRKKGRFRFAHLIEGIRDFDKDRIAAQRIQSYTDFLVSPHLTAWTHFNFVHYKAWSFDHHGVWIGSLNPHEESFHKFNESGVFCMDANLAQEFAKMLFFDQVNSVPLTGNSLGGKNDPKISYYYRRK